MEVREVYYYGNQIVPQAATIFSGSHAADYGCSPWNDYVAINPDGTIDLRGDNLPDRHAFETCYCEVPCKWDWDRHSELRSVSARLPTTRPDGSALQIGDSCTVTVHGSSGSYPEDYVWDGDDWRCEMSTVPWQMQR